MSSWTYVSGVIEVNTCARSTPEAMYLAQTVVNHLPRITGSEGPVEIYCSLPHGHNMSSNCDEFDKPSNLYDSGYFRSFQTQQHVLLTLSGSLRDRYFSQTLRETTNMLARLSTRLWVKTCIVSVRGFEQSFVFDNPEWVLGRDRSNWTDVLLWKWEEKEPSEICGTEEVNENRV